MCITHPDRVRNLNVCLISNSVVSLIPQDLPSSGEERHTEQSMLCPHSYNTACIYMFLAIWRQVPSADGIDVRLAGPSLNNSPSPQRGLWVDWTLHLRTFPPVCRRDRWQTGRPICKQLLMEQRPIWRRSVCRWDDVHRLHGTYTPGYLHSLGY